MKMRQDAYCQIAVWEPTVAIPSLRSIPGEPHEHVPHAHVLGCIAREQAAHTGVSMADAKKSCKAQLETAKAPK